MLWQTHAKLATMGYMMAITLPMNLTAVWGRYVTLSSDFLPLVVLTVPYVRITFVMIAGPTPIDRWTCEGLAPTTSWFTIVVLLCVWFLPSIPREGQRRVETTCAPCSLHSHLPFTRALVWHAFVCRVPLLSWHYSRVTCMLMWWCGRLLTLNSLGKPSTFSCLHFTHTNVTFSITPVPT